MKLSRLAYMLMTLYEMEGSHLFNFYSHDSDEYYALKNGDFAVELDDKDIKTQRLLLSKRSYYTRGKRLFLLMISAIAGKLSLLLKKSSQTLIFLSRNFHVFLKAKDTAL